MLFTETHHNLAHLFSFMLRCRYVYVTILMSKQERVQLRVFNNGLKLGLGTQEKVFEKSQSNFFECIFSDVFTSYILILQYFLNGWSYFFILLLLLLKKALFHFGTIVNFVAVQQHKVCLSFCLDVWQDYKSHKNLSLLRKFGYVLANSSLSLYEKIICYILFTGAHQIL